MSMHEKQLNNDLFQPAVRSSDDAEKITKESTSFWQDARRRLFENKGAVSGLIIIVAILLLAFLGPLFSHNGFDDQDTSRTNLPPRVPVLEKVGFLGLDGVDIRGVDQYKMKNQKDNYYWFGTDALGRDQFVRVWKGTQISLYIAFLAAAIDMVIGVAYGAISGYYGGKTDNIMQRIIEILIGIPNLIVVILMILILDPGILSITFAMVITGWTTMARIVRGQILKLKTQEYVLASVTLGAKSSRILTKHMFPNILGSIIITSMFTIPSAIFTEAFLSFIGLGISPPTASLGSLVNEGFKSLQIYPHLVLYPAVIISLIMISFNLLGDGLRDALDPKMRK
ncbi:oligopeptide transport system permease protein [Fictibacillus enclensis]|uniref:Peptide ABC transporter permease n=2 Tax=Fictibacillus enclensis TaxID=1017270 RepID=A0A0V8JCG1_9BACL|nr:oligopeptide ABC transporter permease [Fictibacillus enclensis]KSU84850.1 peptide ABC transporter permease [Fictibacillus enclensis]SCB86798.1 oligopeptide transport system permease protein [Fictibacillus enclensis]